MSYTHPLNPHIILFYTVISLLFLFFPSFVPTSSASKVSYSDLCKSFIPESTPKRLINPENSKENFHTGYFVTDEPTVPWPKPMYELLKYFSLVWWCHYETDIKGLVHVKARLFLNTHLHGRSVSVPGNYSSLSMSQFGYRSHFVTLFEGFWSQSHGKLCLVGESHGWPRGESIITPVSLKLNNLYNSANITSLITGKLESQNDDLFLFGHPISVVLLPGLNYEYTLVSQELVDTESNNVVAAPSLPLDSFTSSLCHLIFDEQFSLRYTSNCKSGVSLKKCSPMGDLLPWLPFAVLLKRIECFRTPERMRFLIKFYVDYETWNEGTLDPMSTLVGEGIWDRKRNQLFIVACRVLNDTGSWAEAKIGNCSTRLSLTFPSVWTIDNRNSIVGRIWSTKTANESDHFESIEFQSFEGLLAGCPAMKYEYKKIDKAKEQCPKKEPAKNRGTKYLDAISTDMTFDVISSESDSELSRGYAQPIFVNYECYEWNRKTSSRDLSNVNYITNMSYDIMLFNVSSLKSRISAEGIYDAATGSLCMIGCRNVGLNNSDLYSSSNILDCDILVNFQFPPRNDKENQGFIKGSIESKRKKSDPFYFKTLHLSSLSFMTLEAEEYIRKENFEIIAALISNTLSCAFTAFQIFHLRRNPRLAPFVSLTMLLTLTFGYSVTLAMNLKSLTTSSFESRVALLGVGGWLNTRSVTGGITGLILFYFQARLLQLACSERLSHENRNELRTAEKEALVVSLPLYLGGAFLISFSAWSKRNNDIASLSVSLTACFFNDPIWESTKSYANLISDGFLFPQILLNMFMDSRGKSLTCSFYIGMTLLRLLPHVYGLYNAQNSALELALLAWDVMVPFGSLLFAGVIYLQQKSSGRCFFQYSESSI